MASNENDVLEELAEAEEAVSGAADVVTEVAVTAADITSQIQETLNIERSIESIKAEGVYKANATIEENIAKEIKEHIDEEKLDETTKDLSTMIGSASNMLGEVEGATNVILGQVNSTLNVAGQIALTNLDYATRITMSAQDVLRMSFDEIEEKLKKAAIEYSKARAMGIAHAEFQEQLNLYYQAKDLYERVSGLKKTAEGVVTTAKDTITTTKITISRVKSSLITLQNALKIAISLATKL